MDNIYVSSVKYSYNICTKCSQCFDNLDNIWTRFRQYSFKICTLDYIFLIFCKYLDNVRTISCKYLIIYTNLTQYCSYNGIYCANIVWTLPKYYPNATQILLIYYPKTLSMNCLYNFFWTFFELFEIFELL